MDIYLKSDGHVTYPTGVANYNSNNRDNVISIHSDCDIELKKLAQPN